MPAQGVLVLSVRSDLPSGPTNFRCVSGNLGDCLKQLIDFIMKCIALTREENHHLCWGSSVSMAEESELARAG